MTQTEAEFVEKHAQNILSYFKENNINSTNQALRLTVMLISSVMDWVIRNSDIDKEDISIIKSNILENISENLDKTEILFDIKTLYKDQGHLFEVDTNKTIYEIEFIRKK